MRILLTNDDGIHAPGLWHLAEALREVGEVMVCAPDREQSGMGTAVSLQVPVRAVPFPSPLEGLAAFAVEGTPADSVIVGLECLVRGPVDLVVAGINVGANLGEDVLVSGTVGAALQGYFRGVPALALSVASISEVHYRPAALVGRFLASWLASGGVSGPGMPLLLNVNVPNVPQERLEGVALTHLGRRTYAETVQVGSDGRRPWYWITRTRPVWEVQEGTDVWAVQRNLVSITPLQADLTAAEALAPLERLVHALQGALRGG